MNNSSNYDLQRRLPYSIDLTAFILHKNTAKVLNPIHFAHALHVPTKYYLDHVHTILYPKNSSFQKYMCNKCGFIIFYV